MHWDTWALLSILALCAAVICWSAWGFYADSHSGHSSTFRLRLAGGGYLDIPHPPGRAPGRHRTQGRR
ncbi:hypothetical protein [Nocardia sp. CDC160]|uniref:hypothetical protein n=1 Tax=Nocardia sp. CDC160 TaxID=3112166 RepID=UPI002DBFD5B3|nr:hypothetical protein [Nocardia sp. CDC160]MEC3913277.1 hypothetical protein [Nocardia sp. CDC160]